MKQYILLLFFVIVCDNAFCQLFQMETVETAQLVENRVDSLLHTEKYKSLAKTISKRSLIRFETSVYDSFPHNYNDSNEHFIAKNIAIYKLGKKLKHKLEGYKTIYTIQYAIKEDEIVSISEGDM